MQSQDKPNLDTQIEVAPGKLKRYGDCTQADLDAAAELATAKGRSFEFLADVAAEIARLMDASGVGVLTDLPDYESVLHRVVEGCAEQHGLSSELAFEITRREFGWPASLGD